MNVPKVVGVVGGGRMGAGIAQVFAVAGAYVTIAEADESAAAAALQRVEHGLAQAEAKGKLACRPEDALGRVQTVTSVSALPPEANLVVEAVPEIVEAKLAVLTAVEAVVGPEAVIASNTSSLSIGDLGSALEQPTRFLGMHFFNPVPASTLVEVVRAPDTSGSVIKTVLGWVEALGKTDIVVKDSPGFATSRLGVSLGLEAIRMLEEGVADAESIDRAMELGYRHPMGPLRSTDLVGLDVRLAIAEYLHATLGERFCPPQLLRDKVSRGELGRKSGQGFYDWRQ
ncbi:3-hydroxyacyl-CoA dehydrogenase family protein [Nocardia sp. CA2R105]|uniref:3-hydroxyacyl-CoA dehydrogenase family protein n=1 Tax=Nocardia coffeae TaxID=2873381 RepID=UPI001CA78D9E|nr:3-hydroxyacyl-CoA dehydrogenase family protein [Nocardia coffeae]MBY8861980.1 3-hydroxyacyl-CoA dehydrogenase family protein [Nocardia coffeae]